MQRDNSLYGSYFDPAAYEAEQDALHYGLDGFGSEKPQRAARAFALTTDPQPDTLFFHMQDGVWRIRHEGVVLAMEWPRAELGAAEKAWAAVKSGAGAAVVAEAA